MNANSNLKSFILDRNEPIVLKNILKWEMLNWTLKDWGTVLNNEKLEFRCGLNQQTQEPQWDRKCQLREGDFSYFLSQAQSNKKEWLYFDYKQLNSWFKSNDNIRGQIDWSPLGFSDIKPEDCTIWIGSKGAHTPCHIDCYGFNLVYQIYGKKMWLLFPPEENLKPTRVPYEESSIYSKLNFFNPHVNNFKGLANKCRKLELSPGDVLLVPHKWWHYVENLEISISINVWLPSKQDDEERLKESIVQFFIKQMTELSNAEDNKTMLNPNMDKLISENSTYSFLETLIKCKKICREHIQDKKLKNVSKELEQNEGSFFGQIIPVLTREKFLSFLDQQNSRFSNLTQGSNLYSEATSECIEIVQVLTNPEVINVIKNILVKNKS